MTNDKKTKTTKKKTAKKTTAKVTTKDEKVFGPDLYKRDEHGLLKSVEYIFNEDGSVDWRSMIKPEFLYPNKGWFNARKKEVPSSIDGLKDNQLLIMLGGIKDLARLRGFNSVRFSTEREADYVTAKCTIQWNGNYETDSSMITYEDVANATAANTDSFCIKFLETIACNRAFVRCVRNFLNIHIVGADEIDKSKEGFSNSFLDEVNNDPQNIALTPHTALQKAFGEKNADTTYNSFKDVALRSFWKDELYRNEDAKNWEDFSDIPAKECRKLLTLVKKL